MTPIQSAARADKEPIWPNHLRIREAGQPASSSPRVQQTPYIHAMRSAFEHLQAGWKWLERKRTIQLTSRRLRVAETVSLGEKRSVSIVQVDGAQYLIGCSTSSVQLLAVLDRQDAGARQTAAIEKAS